jgi:uncharacterized protein YraI
MTIKQVFPGILIVLGLVSIFLVGPPTGSAHAEMIPQARPYGETHSEIIRQADSPAGLTVRSEPLPNGKIVAYLPVGSKVTYSGGANNGWVHLSAPTAGGWVAESYLGSRNPEALVIGVDNPGQCLTVRNGPGINYEKIGCLPKGANLKLTGTVQEDWAQIVGPMAGWVTAQQIEAPGLFPAKAATSGGTRRGSSEGTVQNPGATGPEYSEQSAASFGQPSDPTGGATLLDFFQQKLQSSQSGLSDNKPGGTGGQNSQPLPNQNAPTTTKTANPDGPKTTTTNTTPDAPITTTEVDPVKITHADGSTTTEEHVVTTTKAKGSDGSNTTVTKDSFAGTTSTATVFPDGRSSTVSLGPDGSRVETNTDGKSMQSRWFDAKGNLTAQETRDNGTGITKKTIFGPDGKPNNSVITRDPVTGTSTITTLRPDGSPERQDRFDASNRPIGTTLCNAPGKCPDPTKTIATQDLQKLNKLQSGAAQALKNKAIAVDPKKLLSAPGADQLKDRAKFQDNRIGAKKIQADVLGQIEGKPAGDLSVGQKSLSTGVLGGKAVELNPQPLPPGPPPPPDKLGGKIQVDKKLQTGATQQFKDKVKVQDLKLGQKWKLGAGSGSQSTGQISKINAASKLNFQTQAAQQNKFKSNHR